MTQRLARRRREAEPISEPISEPTQNEFREWIINNGENRGRYWSGGEWKEAEEIEVQGIVYLLIYTNFFRKNFLAEHFVYTTF